MEFFSSLEDLLKISNPYEKIDNFTRFYADFKTARFDHSQKSLTFTSPSYEGYCDVVEPKEVPKRKRLDTKRGMGILLHAIAHIEYSAIDLALDAAYRFKNMPMEFYRDWLEVADDECRHFLMIDELLKESGYRYGDFPVHKALFEAGLKTDTLIGRMAVVPRYLEANGLDANPKIIARLKGLNHPFSNEVAAALEVILKEEVDHVKKGDRWFRYACKMEGVKDISKKYFEIVESIYPGSKHSKELNKEARKRAGFSCDELKWLSKSKVSC